MSRLPVAALVLCMLCGCATIISGKNETVRIDSEPQGVMVKVDGAHYETPVVISLARDTDHYVVFPNGQRVDITRHFQAAVLGNILLGGVIGLVVDAVSGAATGNLEPDRLMYKDGKVYNSQTKKVILAGGEEVRESETQPPVRQPPRVAVAPAPPDPAPRAETRRPAAATTGSAALQLRCARSAYGRRDVR